MKKILLAALCFVSSPLWAGDKARLSLVYPGENARIGAVDRSFVFGSVHPARAKLSINGIPVKPWRTGSFIAMIPFQPGAFQIAVQADLDGEVSEVLRTVHVSTPSVPLSTETLTILPESARPVLDMELTAGETVPLGFQGTPGCTAETRLTDGTSQKNKDWSPMREKISGTGFYSSELVVPGDLRSGRTRVEYRLTDPNGKSVSEISSATLSVVGREDFSVVEIETGPVNLRTGPSIGSEMMSYDLFLPQGVRMLKDGRAGEEVRLKISEDLSLWTESKNLKVLDRSVPAPRNIIDGIRVENKGRSALVSFEVREKIPYRISVSDDLRTLTLTLYGAVSNIDRIRYDPVDASRISSIRWKQVEDRKLEIECCLRSKVWGTDVRYDGGRMVTEIIFAPAFKEGLKGLVVAVDPGHSPQGGDGAVSPQGIPECEVNFQIAKRLKERLEKAGARPFLTKSAGEITPLIERGKRAWEKKADVFISIHANALPDGADYSDRGGFSVYYFQPQSALLGESVHAAYRKRFRLKDEGFFYGNLSVCRVTQMPSILTESAYLMLPDEEEVLVDPKVQAKIADTITEGLSQFVRKWKERP